MDLYDADNVKRHDTKRLKVWWLARYIHKTIVTLPFPTEGMDELSVWNAISQSIWKEIEAVRFYMNTWQGHGSWEELKRDAVVDELREHAANIRENHPWPTIHKTPVRKNRQ